MTPAIRQASRQLAKLTTKQRNQLLNLLAKQLVKQTPAILRANAKDLKAVPAGYTLTDRLTLTEQRLNAIAKSLEAVIQLPDPLDELLEHRVQPNGLTVERRRVPLGVVGVIYEARPNVTIEVASLCLKTGNAVILKGGRDAYFTNQALVKCIQAALKQLGLPVAIVTMLDPRQRQVSEQLLHANGLVDVVIPRGSDRLIQFVRQTATVPVIETGAGVCHTLVEHTANMQSASVMITNAKTRRCTVCNTLDCLVIEQRALEPLVKKLAPLLQRHQVELRADTASYAALKTHYPKALLKKAKPSDYGKEFLALVLAIKVVPNAQAGIAFIQQYTSGHSEAIITNNAKLAKQFQQEIDAAAVYVNTSTAFTDGFEFGLGAEVGISTQKLHARGPMGLTALTTYKWFVESQGAIRQA